VNFQLLQNSTKFHRNTRIPRLGSKFHGPQKTTGPIDKPHETNNI